MGGVCSGEQTCTKFWHVEADRLCVYVGDCIKNSSHPIRILYIIHKNNDYKLFPQASF
jgi:hypothetical protein